MATTDTQVLLAPLTNEALYKMHDQAAYNVASAAKGGYHREDLGATYRRRHFDEQLEKFRLYNDAVHQRIHSRITVWAVPA